MPNSIYEALVGLQNKLGQLAPGLKPVPAGEQLAQKELERYGSVMARPEKAEWRKQSPALDTLFGGLIDAMKAPIENIGGPSQAILGPIRTKAQKQIAKAIFRGDPEVLQQMSASLKHFNIESPSLNRPKDPHEFQRALNQMADIGSSYGVNMEYPLKSELLIHPLARKGRAPTGQIYGSPAAGNEPDLVATALHEALHGFNAPLARQTGNATANALTKSIETQLNPTGKAALTFLAGEPPQRLLGEALSYLGESARRGGGPVAKDYYTAFKKPMFESTEKEAETYLRKSNIRQQLSDALKKGLIK
jgi:hypothetical protein